MAFIPLAHTLLTVVQITSSGKPANFEACWPALAQVGLEHTTHQHFLHLLRPDASIRHAPLMAKAPSRVAEKSFRAPPKLPIGVRTAGDDDDFFVIHKKNHLKYGAKIRKDKIGC